MLVPLFGQMQPNEGRTLDYADGAMKWRLNRLPGEVDIR